jgi:hypothetical protein
MPRSHDNQDNQPRPLPASIDRRQFLSFSGAALMGLILSGCGGGSGGGIGGGGAPASGRAVVKPEVEILPEDGSVQILNVADGSLTLRGGSAAPRPGSVLVSGKGEGFLRKVTSVSSPAADGTITVQTTQATLEDVFEEAQFNVKIPVGAEDVKRVETPLAGVEFVSQAPAGARSAHLRSRMENRAVNLTPFEFAFKGVKIAGSDEVELAGKAKLQVELDIDGTIEDSTLTAFTCVFNIKPEAEIELICRKKVSRELFKVPYAHLYLEPIVFFIGVVPIVIVPKIDISTEMIGALEGGVSFTSGVQVPIKAGAVYKATTGWDPVATADITGNLLPKANAFAALKVEFNPARVDIQAHLYGVAGPELTLIAPSFEVAFEAKAGSDLSVKLSASAAAKATIGMEVEVLGKQVASYKKERALEIKTPLFEKTFLPGGGEIEVK